MEVLEVKTLGKIEKRINGIVQELNIFVKKIGTLFIVEDKGAEVSVAFHEIEVGQDEGTDNPTSDDLIKHFIAMYYLLKLSEDEYRERERHIIVIGDKLTGVPGEKGQYELEFSLKPLYRYKSTITVGNG